MMQEDWRQLSVTLDKVVIDVGKREFSTDLIHTVEALVEYNVAQLQASGQPIATIKAVHTGPNAAKAPADDAGGLEAVVCHPGQSGH